MEAIIKVKKVPFVKINRTMGKLSSKFPLTYSCNMESQNAIIKLSVKNHQILNELYRRLGHIKGIKFSVESISGGETK